jgi:hypothetical protein
MQTLYLLGCPVEGELDPSIKKRDDLENDPLKEVREEHADKMNPRGFFEVPGVVIRGTRNQEKFGGKILKVVSNGVYPQTGTPLSIGTPPEIVDKYILCVRKPMHIAVSQMDLVSQTFAGSKSKPGTWAPLKSMLSPIPYIIRTGGLVGWLSEQDDSLRAKFLPVLYDNMIDNPRGTIQTIIEHLEIQPDPKNIEAAVANISTDLRRSDTLEEWPEDLKISGITADSIFDALLSLDPGDLASAAVYASEFIRNQHLESIQWVDDEDTWATITAQTKRDLITNKNGIADNMRERLSQYRENRLICSQCSYYNRDEIKTYEMQRPLDLGTLVRPFVVCGRDNEFKTVEVCKHCWQRGSIYDGEVLDPQRHRRK